MIKEYPVSTIIGHFNIPACPVCRGSLDNTNLWRTGNPDLWRCANCKTVYKQKK